MAAGTSVDFKFLKRKWKQVPRPVNLKFWKEEMAAGTRVDLNIWKGEMKAGTLGDLKIWRKGKWKQVPCLIKTN